MAAANRLPRETVVDEVNRLINWYEMNKPSAGKSIQVNLSPKILHKNFGGMPPDLWKKTPAEAFEKTLRYRGRTLVAVG